MFFSLMGILPGMGEKEVTTTNPKKRRRQQFLQNYRYTDRMFRSENGVLIVLGFNFMILLYSVVSLFKTQIDHTLLFFISFGTSFYLVYLFLDKNDFYKSHYVPRQMKRPYEERFRDNMKTFLVFSVLPAIWLVWIINK